MQTPINYDPFWPQSFAHVIVLWQIQIFICFCTILALFYIRRGNVMGFFCITSLGGLYLEGLFFRILRYIQVKIF